MQLQLFDTYGITVEPFNLQLLKWVGNKQRFAHEIISFFPSDFNRYFEPFLGSGAVLATLRPVDAFASDCFKPLITIFQTLQNDPKILKDWYKDRWEKMMGGEKTQIYENIKASYNTAPNAADLLFLCRTCYGGVVRFRKLDGYMSTPCGIHNPVSPESFSRRVDVWRERTKGTTFRHMDFNEAADIAKRKDIIYCDPPYSDSQAILYGAQNFKLKSLFEKIEELKMRGVYVALSIDGKKYSGKKLCKIPVPENLFEREVFVNCGPSMLKRFQMEGKSLEEHMVSDRLLLTY